MLAQIDNYDGYFAVVDSNNLKKIDRNEKNIFEFDEWHNNFEIVGAFNFNDLITQKCNSLSILYSSETKKWSDHL